MVRCANRFCSTINQNFICYDPARFICSAHWYKLPLVSGFLYYTSNLLGFFFHFEFTGSKFWLFVFFMQVKSLKWWRKKVKEQRSWRFRCRSWKGTMRVFRRELPVLESPVKRSGAFRFLPGLYFKMPVYLKAALVSLWQFSHVVVLEYISCHQIKWVEYWLLSI